MEKTNVTGFAMGQFRDRIFDAKQVNLLKKLNGVKIL